MIATNNNIEDFLKDKLMKINKKKLSQKREQEKKHMLTLILTEVISDPN